MRGQRSWRKSIGDQTVKWGKMRGERKLREIKQVNEEGNGEK
jgi:hypothetical protein